MKYLLFICSEGEPFDATPEELDATPWVEEEAHASCMSLSQLEPGKTTMPNFIISVLKPQR